MITGITIRNFKGIKSVVDLPLDRFHVLVGPNASGKTTFLEAMDFIRACLVSGPRKAVEDLNLPDFDDLTYMRRGGKVSIAISLDLSSTLSASGSDKITYLVEVGKNDGKGIVLTDEELIVSVGGKPRRLLGRTTPGKVGASQRGRPGKNTHFYQRENGKGRDLAALPLDRSALAVILPDEERYPTANAVKNYLTQGIRYIQLNSRAMRLPCPATRGTDLELDGTNLARVVGKLRFSTFSLPKGKKLFMTRPWFKSWREHLQYALPQLKDIGWSKRESDNAEFIIIKYKNGLEIPSWLLSDGTLRMLALTILAFLPESPAIYLVEEPENGVHPKALEVILGALQSIPGGQVLAATHSPLVVQTVGREPLLCFFNGEEGVKVIRGEEHLAFQDWDGTPDLATVFATGVLE